jgi:hypothetical protein
MSGLGKIQRRILRAFTASPGAQLTTMDLIVWCFPRRTEPVGFKHRVSVWRAAPAVAVKVGRTYPGGFIWVGKDSQHLPSDTSQLLPRDKQRE